MVKRLGMTAMQQPVTESRNAITEHRIRVAELARIRAAVTDSTA
jgi:hypothetical protein